MKLYFKLAGVVCALLVATASSALAVTYNESATDGSYSGPEAIFTEADRLDSRDDTSSRVSVMIRRNNTATVTNDIVKATTGATELTWFQEADATNTGEIVYINEAAPENDPSYTYASDLFETEHMFLKEALTEGRYALTIGTSADLQVNGTSPKSEDTNTPIYTEYFNVYRDGTTKSIGMRWKDAKTGKEMRAMTGTTAQPCKADDDKYHVAYIADMYGAATGDQFGMIFSYTDGSTNKTLKAVAPFTDTNSVTICGDAALRFGIEVCNVPADVLTTFKAEGFIIEEKEANR